LNVLSARRFSSASWVNPEMANERVRPIPQLGSALSSSIFMYMVTPFTDGAPELSIWIKAILPSNLEIGIRGSGERPPCAFKEVRRPLIIGGLIPRYDRKP
jgi:hypothetical protein